MNLADVAPVHERHALALLGDRVFDRRAHEALGAFLRYGLDADARRPGKRILLYCFGKACLKSSLNLRFSSVGLELDADVDVLGVFTEDHHVDLCRVSVPVKARPEPAHRATDVEIEHLPQRDVQRTDAAADRRRQRTLDRYEVLAARGDGLSGSQC